MRYLILSLISFTLSNSAVACMSGTEYYSVVIPRNLALDSGAQTLFVGDMLVLGPAFKITRGEAGLKEMGFNDKAGYSSGKFYLVEAEGEIELSQNFDKKETKVLYTAKTPPRARGMGGCADYRRPASETTPAAKK